VASPATTRSQARRLAVVSLVDRRRNTLCRYLRSAGHHVLETYTADQTVAVAVSKRIDVAVLDQDFFLETEGWSVARSLKMVRPGICVVLVSRAQNWKQRLPQGVDLVLSHSDEPRLLTARIEQLHSKQRAKAQKSAG